MDKKELIAYILKNNTRTEITKLRAMSLEALVMISIQIEIETMKKNSNSTLNSKKLPMEKAQTVS